MKFKSFLKFVLVIGLIFAGLFLNGDRILTALGRYLFIDEKAGQVDAVVSGAVTERVIALYKTKKVKKIFLLIREDADTWRALRRIDREKKLRKKIRQAGVPEKDFIIFRSEFKSTPATVRFLKEQLSNNNIRSALLFIPGYQTRTCRFYLDRYLSGSGILTFVQPLNEGGQPSLENWWDNTVLANYFLDQYLEMGFYYFHKLLWSSNV